LFKTKNTKIQLESIRIEFLREIERQPSGIVRISALPKVDNAFGVGIFDFIFQFAIVKTFIIIW